MTKANITQENDNLVSEFINSLDNDQDKSDCQRLIEIMSKVSGCEPKMWGSSIIGFDKYHYVYDSGREGDAPIIGFSPRKSKLTLYIESEIMESDLFSTLGKYTTSKVCIYIKHLSDIDLEVLTQILQKSYQYTKSLNYTK